MKQDLLDQRIETIRRRLEALCERSVVSPDLAAPLHETLAALITALQEREARTQAILNTVIDGIITIDGLGIIRSFNPAAERLFGYSAEEMIGQSVNGLMPSPYDDQHDDYVASYIRTGIKKVIGIGREVIGRRKDGTLFPMELAVSELRVGEHQLFTGIVRDITARKRAEEAIRSSEARFQAFMDNSPVVAFMKDEAGRYAYVNATYERFFQTSAADIRGKTDFDIIPVDVAERVRANDRGVLEGGRPVELEETVPTPDGRVREWTAYKFPVTDAEGRRFVGGIALDITERKHADAQLRELQELTQQRNRLADIGAITAQIVHDVGNPLAGISMQAQLILRRAQRDASQPLSTILKPAERIVSEVSRLDALIKEFMEFAREQRLDLKPMNVRGFIEQAVDLWQPVAAVRAISVSMTVPEQVPSLIADEEKLRRVVDNLVKNAIEAMERGPGRIEIHATMPTSETVRISVADTGPGISESVEVFRLFETTKAHGTGVGLAVAKQIVLAHRGSIRHAPRAPRGTVFHIELPCSGPLT